jgi:hypothetical protein
VSAPDTDPPHDGRRLTGPAFAGDAGGPDPTLAAVLAAYQHGGCGDAEVLAALDGARLLVPVTALPVAEPGGAGQQVEMALPVMVGTDGRRALPAFTSLEALAAWDTSARPVPVVTAQAAAGAVQEGCAFLVIDPAGPATWVADRAQVERLAGTA